MFKIYDGREHFYQWDTNVKLIVEDPSIIEVHFCNRTDDCSLVCETYVEDGLTLVNVPNILLQTDWKIRVYAYDGSLTKHDECYEVKSRTKPADYAYEETEVLTWHTISEKVDTTIAEVNAAEEARATAEAQRESNEADREEDYAILRGELEGTAREASALVEILETNIEDAEAATKDAVNAAADANSAAAFAQQSAEYAVSAAGAAETAAYEASQATTRANEATEAAAIAAGTAVKATDAAMKATEDANAAAIRANEAADIVTYDKADILVLTSATGKNVEINDSAELPAVNYTVYGESTQEGTPTPNAPIDIVSLGELVTDETDANYKKYKIAIATYRDAEDTNPVISNIYLDKPLRRVKANHPDFPNEEDICDYIDFKRGVVVRNVGEYTVKSTNGLLMWNVWDNSATGRRIMLACSPAKKDGNKGATLGYFNMGKTYSTIKYKSKSNYLSTYTSGSEVYWHLDYTLLGLDGTESKSDATTVLKQWVENLEKQGIKIYFNYVLKKPTETKIDNLPEIATTYPNTTVVCDGDIKLEYKADTTNAYNNLKSELETLTSAIISLGGNI